MKNFAVFIVVGIIVLAMADLLYILMPDTFNWYYLAGVLNVAVINLLNEV
jgi:hypothetical protein